VGFCGLHPECIPSFQILNQLLIFTRRGVNIIPLDEVPTPCLSPAMRNINTVDARTCRVEHLVPYACRFLGMKMIYDPFLGLGKFLRFLEVTFGQKLKL
jgi:hypothetical protein